MANRYNDQDYPRYYERNDRYDSRSESRSFDRNRGNRGSSSSSDYDRSGSRDEGYSGITNDRDWGTNPQSGYPGGNFMSDFGRGYNQQSRDTEDFESATRPSRNYTGGFDRNTESDRDDYTLYGYNDRFSQSSGSDRERGNYGRGGDYGYGGGSSSNYGSGSDRERTRNFDRTDASSYGRGSGSERGFDRYSDTDRSNQSFYGQGGGYAGSERGYDYDRDRSNRGEDRGWWEKTSDEVSSWFGDEEAARRRERDQREGFQTSHRGRGPKNYRRSDDRIKEDVNDRLTDYPYLDASDIDVEVSNAEVTLTGTVESRYAKRMAEDIAEDVSGVSNVENRLRVKQSSSSFGSSSDTSNFSSTAANTSSSGTTGTTGMTGASTGTSGSTTDTSFGSSTGTASETGTSSPTGTTSSTSTGNTGDANTSATGRARSKSA